MNTRVIAIGTHQEECDWHDEAKDPLVEANVLIHPPDELDDALGISYGISHLFERHSKQRPLSVNTPICTQVRPAEGRATSFTSRIALSYLKISFRLCATPTPSCYRATSSRLLKAIREYHFGLVPRTLIKIRWGCSQGGIDTSSMVSIVMLCRHAALHTVNTSLGVVVHGYLLCVEFRCATSAFLFEENSEIQT